MTQTFRDEVATLRGIFPSWEMEALQELLKTHEGNVESTVDSLLAMEATHVAAEAQRLQMPRCPVLAHGSLSRCSHSMEVPLSAPKRKPYSLSNEFLRLPSDEICKLSETEERDAIVARMLQDEFFRDEVLFSEEFSSHFHDNRFSRQSQRDMPNKTAARIASETYTALSDKIASMSGVMKSKMHEMYMRFQMRDDAPISKDFKSLRPLMESDSESSVDEDRQFSPDIRQPDVEVRHGQTSPRQSSPTRRSNANTGTYSKKAA